MIVQYFILSNATAIEQADRLGIPLPKAEFIKRPMVLNIKDVFSARITQENNIDLILTDGYSYEIEFKQEIWDCLTETINAREKSE